MDKKIIHLNSVDSTNAYIKDLARKGADEGTVVVADSQTCGRGRLGRSFLSPEGGLYMSVLLRPETSAFDSLTLTAAAAVAVARAIESLCNKKCGIKWVNDIYLNEKKVCGILTEGAIEKNSKLSFAVVGIGINITEPSGGFPDEIKDIATSLFSKNNAPENFKNILLDAVLCEFFSIYKNLSDTSFLNFYRERSILSGKEISYTKNGKSQYAKVLEIDGRARLVCEDENGRFLIDSGEVTVRIKKDEKD